MKLAVEWCCTSLRCYTELPPDHVFFPQRRGAEKKKHQRYFHNKPAGFPSDLKLKLLTFPASEGQVREGERRRRRNMNRAVELVQKGKWREWAPTSFWPLWSKIWIYWFFLFSFLKIVFPLNSCFHFSGSMLSHLLPRTLSSVSLFIKISLLGDGGVLLIEILYRISMGMVNFVARQRKTALVKGWKGGNEKKEQFVKKTLAWE